MLKINLSRQAAKRLKKLPDKHAKQVATKITELLSNPYPQDSLRLKGYPYHRADIGEYRIVYYVEEQTLEILLIDKRNDDEVYKQLKRMI
ncbi:type II toxin-antitoxin system RelE/ParE family toxin [Pseudanabaena sp. FACHB-1998]|uniref:type II toxin-antitoxin system RelE family toxin n=1 Tax=Pseudanabaena sp. FACHB-1998 TaxID=2692858 RepID=UPI0016807291|nr:type II toxin-antitoxin system RelE/ParE family toxin [Pseudanabaena sp. FACHB-1998]MBD2177534.1 type II toxin-antitoxin system RelE/ParE family toxin [Pseudanabaena sp. FACHB-1998]